MEEPFFYDARRGKLGTVDCGAVEGGFVRFDNYLRCAVNNSYIGPVN
jgi:hypothetical protein